MTATPRSPLRSRASAFLPLVVLTVTLFAFALRMFRVADLLMWGDEGFSIFSASRDWLTITLDTTSIDPHPPLYYFLLHVYFALFGYSELAIRFFSVFFGTATIAMVWQIGKRMFGARAGVLAACIVALAPFAVHYSQEVRMYALAMFLVALGLDFFVRLFARETRRDWLGYVLAMWLALYTLYHTGFVFLAIGLVLLPLFKTRRAFVLRWFAVSFGVVATFLPWLAFRFASAFTGIKDVAGKTLPMDFFTYLARGFAAISVGTTIPLATALQLSAAFALVIVIALGITFAARTAKFYDALLVSLSLVPILAYYPLYLALPLYRGRLFALACIPLMLLFARALMIIEQRARLGLIIGVMFFIGVSAYSLNDYFFRYNRYSPVVEDYLPALREIGQRAQLGDVVLIHASWHQGYFLSHYTGAPLEFRAVDLQGDLEYAIAAPRNVWAIVQALPHHGAEDWLAARAFFIDEKKFGQMRVLQYRAGMPMLGENFSAPITFSNGMQLLGYHLNAETLQAGRDVVTLQLDWQTPQNIPDDYTVSVRLTNSAGDVIWAQNDTPPLAPTSSWRAGQGVIDRHAFIIPPGIPPGNYSVQVVVYASDDGRVANIIAPENRRGGAMQTGSVQISKGNLPPNALAKTMDARWNEIALTSFDKIAPEIWAGETLPLTLQWRALALPARNFFAEIKIIDSTGAASANMRYAPANAFPTNVWISGDTFIDKVNLTLAADAAPGDARMLVSVVDEKGIVIRPGEIEISKIKINARPHRFDLPTPQFKSSATLGGKIKLLGYDLDPKNIALVLYWQATEKIAERYSVFVHLLDAKGNIVAQRDSEPAAGAAPTTSWLRGEVIADAHRIDVPANLAPGEYTLMIGMYQAANGMRLVIDETKVDYLLLTKIAR